jgi:hypothetical protein
MHRFAFLIATLSVIAFAACEEPRKSKRGGDDDDDGNGGSGATTGNGGNGLGGEGPGGSGGGTCSPGGAACQAFDDCCSGVCDNQVCTDCAGSGESCSLGCCTGLVCNRTNFTCGSCLPDGDSCQLASECCSNVCELGFCGETSTVCDQPSCGTCFGAACAQGACSFEWSNCSQNPECIAMIACFNGCADDFNCMNQCVMMHPDGQAEALPYLQCASCTPDVCDVECSGAIPC